MWHYLIGHICGNNDSITHHFRDITTLTVCDLEKSFRLHALYDSCVNTSYMLVRKAKGSEHRLLSGSLWSVPSVTLKVLALSDRQCFIQGPFGGNPPQEFSAMHAVKLINNVNTRLTSLTKCLMVNFIN